MRPVGLLVAQEHLPDARGAQQPRLGQSLHPGLALHPTAPLLLLSVNEPLLLPGPKQRLQVAHDLKLTERHHLFAAFLIHSVTALIEVPDELDVLQLGRACAAQQYHELVDAEIAIGPPRETRKQVVVACGNVAHGGQVDVEQVVADLVNIVDPEVRVHLGQQLLCEPLGLGVRDLVAE